MTVSFNGKPPIVVVPSPINPVKRLIHVESTKRYLGEALANGRQHSAADVLNEAEFSLVGETLEIQTELSAKMLPVVFNAEAMKCMASVLAERGAGHIKIELLPVSTASAAPESPVSEMLSAPFKRLAESAAKLNKVSDQLTTQIEQIDAALKNLNLGVTAWVMIAENEDEDGNWIEEELGYARIGSRWGVALRTHSGTRGTDPNQPEETFSAFADAPRQLRMRAVRHIPKLIDQLSVEAEAMIEKLSPEVEEVSALARALQASGVKK